MTRQLETKRNCLQYYIVSGLRLAWLIINYFKKEAQYSESVKAMKALPLPILSFCTYEWQIIKPG
jgi:hypothetical protein